MQLINFLALLSNVDVSSLVHLRVNVLYLITASVQKLISVINCLAFRLDLYTIITLFRYAMLLP